MSTAEDRPDDGAEGGTVPQTGAHGSRDRGSNDPGFRLDTDGGQGGGHHVRNAGSANSGAQIDSSQRPITGTDGNDLLYGGSCFDSLKFDDRGLLDLALLGGEVSGIEKADTTATGHVELKLTFQDLLIMTDSGHQLTIVGDSGDKVSADFSGHNVAVTDMGAFTRYVIDGGAATLDIDNHVQKNIIGI